MSYATFYDFCNFCCGFSTTFPSIVTPNDSAPSGENWFQTVNFQCAHALTTATCSHSAAVWLPAALRCSVRFGPPGVNRSGVQCHVSLITQNARLSQTYTQNNMQRNSTTKAAVGRCRNIQEVLSSKNRRWGRKDFLSLLVLWMMLYIRISASAISYTHSRTEAAHPTFCLSCKTVFCIARKKKHICLYFFLHIYHERDASWRLPVASFWCV